MFEQVKPNGLPSRIFFVFAILGIAVSMVNAKETLTVGDVTYLKINHLAANSYSSSDKPDLGYSTSGLSNCQTILRGQSARRLVSDLRKMGFNAELNGQPLFCLGADVVRVTFSDGVVAYYDGQWLVGRKLVVGPQDQLTTNETREIINFADLEIMARLADLSSNISHAKESSNVMDIIHIRQTVPQWLSVLDSTSFEKPSILSSRFNRDIGTLLDLRYPEELKFAQTKTKQEGGNVSFHYYVRDDTDPQEGDFGRFLMISDAPSIFEDRKFMDMFLFLDYYIGGQRRISQTHDLQADLLANLNDDTSLYSNLTVDTRFEMDYSRRIRMIHNYTDTILPRNEAEVAALHAKFNQIDEFSAAYSKMLNEIGPDSVTQLLYAEEISEERGILSSALVDLANRLKENQELLDKSYTLCYQRLSISLNEQSHADNLQSLTETRFGLVIALAVPLLVLFFSSLMSIAAMLSYRYGIRYVNRQMERFFPYPISKRFEPLNILRREKELLMKKPKKLLLYLSKCGSEPGSQDACQYSRIDMDPLMSLIELLKNAIVQHDSYTATRGVVELESMYADLASSGGVDLYKLTNYFCQHIEEVCMLALNFDERDSVIMSFNALESMAEISLADDTGNSLEEVVSVEGILLEAAAHKSMGTVSPTAMHALLNTCRHAAKHCQNGKCFSSVFDVVIDHVIRFNLESLQQGHAKDLQHGMAAIVELNSVFIDAGLDREASQLLKQSRHLIKKLSEEEMSHHLMRLRQGLDMQGEMMARRQMVLTLEELVLLYRRMVLDIVRFELEEPEEESFTHLALDTLDSIKSIYDLAQGSSGLEREQKAQILALLRRSMDIIKIRCGKDGDILCKRCQEILQSVKSKPAP